MNPAPSERPLVRNRYNGHGEELRRPFSPADGGLADGLSVDLEDYFQVEAFASRIPRSRWAFFPSSDPLQPIYLKTVRGAGYRLLVGSGSAHRFPSSIGPTASASLPD
jgi:hypothetical protein